MKQHERFTVKGEQELVCKLKRSLYRLKQSLRMWYQNFDTYILGLGFVRSKVDHCVYCKQVGEYFIYVMFYVDDTLLVGNNMEVIQEVKSQLSSNFDMKDLNATNLILGMEIKTNRANTKLWFNQRKFDETTFQRFNIMQDCTLVKVPILVGTKLSLEKCHKTHEEVGYMFHVPYANVVGCLMYAMASTKPYIAHAMGFLRRYMSKPGKNHWTVVKRVFRYLRGTTNYAICYQGRFGSNRVINIQGSTYANRVGDLYRGRSTSGYVFNIFGIETSWISRR